MKALAAMCVFYRKVKNTSWQGQDWWVGLAKQLEGQEKRVGLTAVHVQVST